MSARLYGFVVVDRHGHPFGARVYLAHHLYDAQQLCRELNHVLQDPDARRPYRVEELWYGERGVGFDGDPEGERWNRRADGCPMCATFQLLYSEEDEKAVDQLIARVHEKRNVGSRRIDGWITDRDPKEEGLYLVSIGRYRGVRYWLDGWMGQETPDGWMQIPAPVDCDYSVPIEVWYSRADGWITDRNPAEEGWYLVAVKGGDTWICKWEGYGVDEVGALVAPRWWWPEATDREVPVVAWRHRPEYVPGGEE